MIRSTALIVLTLLLWAGCSQDEHTKKHSDKKIESIETKVVKTKNGDEALVCLKDDGKVTCKLLTKRVNKKRNVEFVWKSPSGDDNRERELVLPANYASVYDARTIAGREKGLWHVEVEIDDEEVTATFKL